MKELQIQDFKVGNFYLLEYTHSGSSKYIVRCLGDGRLEGLGINTRCLYSPTIFNNKDCKARFANRVEINWLKEAIKAGKYIEMPEFKRKLFIW